MARFLGVMVTAASLRNVISLVFALPYLERNSFTLLIRDCSFLYVSRFSKVSIFLRRLFVMERFSKMISSLFSLIALVAQCVSDLSSCRFDVGKTRYHDC